MKTASEYLQEAYKVIEAKQSSDHKDVDPPILEAMQIYAKQEAIEFGKWLLDEFEPGVYDEDEYENLYEPLYQEDYEKNGYRMDELYEMWKYMNK